MMAKHLLLQLSNDAFYSAQKESEFMKSKLLILLIAGLIFSGCDYKFSETPKDEENSTVSNIKVSNQSNNNSIAIETNKTASNSASKTEAESTDTSNLILAGTSENATFPCSGREVEIGNDATANTYNFTGECKKITVDGVSNTVNVEKVGEISVKGISNKVIYGEGIGGKKPKITKDGPSTSVDSKKSIEEKKAKATPIQ